ncbi:NADH dehydrogenase [ubiquinone] 1 alpha subcomplex subunit 6 [Microplitis mediator]|uniref:NADH dehydrogenase [ubiquinone] 1 alpha subcomplex subunit 6 n=1 Tax=Microplitis mediator TaxID=375433 RepID=UPI0025525B02|nr:NADH dehydrogenase [ubiquinone] 1 alpha subcomplex subunit 6 [Microplitis mediator]
MSTPVRAVRQVKPVLSLNKAEAHRRVLNLYRAWYRQIPYIVMDYHIPKTEEDLKAKIREKFYEHKDVRDIRVIDLLVIKGQMELKETAEKWKNKGTFMNYFSETVEKKPSDFMSKFLSGHD